MTENSDNNENKEADTLQVPGKDGDSNRLPG